VQFCQKVQKTKIGKGNLGRFVLLTKNKHREAMLSNPPMKGKHHSLDTKRNYLKEEGRVKLELERRHNSYS